MTHLHADSLMRARTRSLYKSSASAVSLVSASPSISPVSSPPQKKKNLFIARLHGSWQNRRHNVCRRFQSELVIWSRSRTLLQSVMAEKLRLYAVSVFQTESGEQSSGEDARDPLHMSQTRTQDLGVASQGQRTSQFQFVRLPVNGARSPAFLGGSVAAMMYPTRVRPVPTWALDE